MAASCKADITDNCPLFVLQIRWLWREQWPFKVRNRIFRRMGDIFWVAAAASSSQAESKKAWQNYQISKKSKIHEIHGFMVFVDFS